MKRGKQTCRILKEIRKQIAEANDIEFITSECQYQGDCLGTCPKCESEVRYLEQQLEYKRMAGKAITILGLSAGIMATIPVTSCTNATNKGNNVVSDTLQAATSDTICSTNQTEAINPTDSTTCVPSNKQNSALEFITPKKENVAIMIGDVRNDDSEELQVQKEVSENDTLDIAEQMPEFPGGKQALMKFIADNVTPIDVIVQGNGAAGRTIVQFIVDKEGNVVNPKVVRGVDPFLDKDALRVVRLMPKWKPGMQNGKNVAVKFTVPVAFKLQ